MDPSWETERNDFFSGLRSWMDLVRLLDWMPDVHFFAKNREGRFMAVNRASLMRHGLSAESQIIGKTDYDFHPAPQAAAYLAEDQRVMDSAEVSPERCWLVQDYSGAQNWYISSKHPLFAKSGRVVGVAGLMRPVETAPLLAASYNVMTPAMDWVLGHYAERITMRELADLVGLSVSQFERRFRSLFGMVPTAYILLVRINAARAMLAKGSKSLGDIALVCGFYDQSQFGRLFKRETGTTPKEYRRFFQHGEMGIRADAGERS